MTTWQKLHFQALKVYKATPHLLVSNETRAKMNRDKARVGQDGGMHEIGL